MVVGDGRDDEKVFKWANGLGEEGVIKEVVTVSLGSRNTEAGATLKQGVSGKLVSPLTTSHRRRFESTICCVYPFFADLPRRSYRSAETRLACLRLFHDCMARTSSLPRLAEVTAPWTAYQTSSYEQHWVAL